MGIESHVDETFFYLLEICVARVQFFVLVEVSVLDGISKKNHTPTVSISLFRSSSSVKRLASPMAGSSKERLATSRISAINSHLHQ
ncbi:transmembrane protein, putative [Medicago truncatula]|uniref:Transmembrane protein, putative n=1 Tax=Medicago truncatula TaxID=3880 RepID=A0A072TM20_MEDTR|nr:transmembrane protein, putative [Medicago truncatula]